MTEEDVVATVRYFGDELLFAVLGLEIEPKGTVATFEVELRGRRLLVTVAPQEATPA